MASLRALRDGLTDDSLRVAILAGLATIPFTLVLSWEPVSDDVVVVGGSIAGAPLLLAGLLVGYHYSDRSTESKRAGMWTGLAGSIGTVLVYLANTVATVGTAPSEMTVIVAVLAPVAVAIGVGLSVLVATIGALLGDWVTTRVDRDRRVPAPRETVDRETASSRWWHAVVVYALVAPVVLLSAFWVPPESDAGFVVTWLGLLVLVILSIVACVGLFLDATTPRDVRTGWVPNVWAYVGVPLGVYALVYVTAALRESVNPSGDAMYGFIVALWITSVIYLSYSYRYSSAQSTTPP